LDIIYLPLAPAARPDGAGARNCSLRAGSIPVPGETAHRGAGLQRTSSDLSVAGWGAGERLEISSLIPAVMARSAAASDASSWPTLRAPMIGAVTAGCEATQATARVAGSTPLSRA